MLGGWRPDGQGTRPDEMSTQQRIQNSDLRLVRPLLLTHRAHQAQSEILADGYRYSNSVCGRMLGSTPAIRWYKVCLYAIKTQEVTILC